MSIYQVGTSKFEVHAARNVHAKYVYAHKQLQSKIFEYEEYINTTRKRI